MTFKLKLLVASSLLLSAASFAQQPGPVEYNTVLMPAHGVGDTRSPSSAVRWGDAGTASSKPGQRPGVICRRQPDRIFDQYAVGLIFALVDPRPFVKSDQALLHSTRSPR
ncbi:hypothetical protein [Stenotrophomonas sp. SAU14A_NAIMI4_5]|uniref:hypothetical protein n=1 Tax=Stenotrophomonas sp. SAU14A_NAIMI4_5 TaxID=2072413 RepID=UPI00131F3838|nr:hypothetical protein [Stenotrophomonas sp. SAU14A_NAIMI4_5]